MGRAWIIGNGPSLMRTPLNLLEGEDTFAVNHIYKIFPYTAWRPKFYVRTDDWGADQMYGDVYEELNNEISSVLDAGALAFLGSYFYNTMSKVKKYRPSIQCISPICGEQQWHLSDGQRGAPQKWHMVGKDRITEYCSFGGSLSVAIQVACFGMGRREKYDAIYLLGCDLGYKDYESNHFIDSYRDVIVEHTPSSIIEEDKIHAHKIAKACSPIPIYNATIGGSLEVYERVDIMDVL